MPPSIGNLFLRFDVHPSECSSAVIQSNGLEVHRLFANPFTTEAQLTNSTRFMVASSRGFKSGLNVWQIEAMQDHGEEIIGVTANVDDCAKLMWIGYTKGDTYYYYGGK